MSDKEKEAVQELKQNGFTIVKNTRQNEVAEEK